MVLSGGRTAKVPWIHRAGRITSALNTFNLEKLKKKAGSPRPPKFSGARRGPDSNTVESRPTKRRYRTGAPGVPDVCRSICSSQLAKVRHL